MASDASIAAGDARSEAGGAQGETVKKLQRAGEVAGFNAGLGEGEEVSGAKCVGELLVVKVKLQQRADRGWRRGVERGGPLEETDRGVKLGLGWGDVRVVAPAPKERFQVGGADGEDDAIDLEVRAGDGWRRDGGEQGLRLRKLVAIEVEGQELGLVVREGAGKGVGRVFRVVAGEFDLMQQELLMRGGRQPGGAVEIIEDLQCGGGGGGESEDLSDAVGRGRGAVKKAWSSSLER